MELGMMARVQSLPYSPKTPFSQLISIFNYYIDPTHYQMYLEKCHFFPQLNNELVGVPK